MDARGSFTTVNDALTFEVSDAFAEEVTFSQSGGVGGTVVLEGTSDGTTWVVLEFAEVDALGTALTVTTAAGGTFRGSISGFTQARLRLTAITSGTVTVVARTVRVAA